MTGLKFGGVPPRQHASAILPVVLRISGTATPLTCQLSSETTMLASLALPVLRPGSAPLAPRSALAPPRCAPSPACCICINCKFVDRCKVYHWVETMHEQPHVTEEQKLDFDPSDPQVQVFLRSEEEAASAEGSRPLLTTEYDVFECDAFTPDMGRWVRLMPEADFIPT